VSPAKRFLLILGGVAFVVWIGMNVWMGPPGLSRDYLAKHDEEHDHYLDIIKSDEYKLYEQRPALHDPHGPDAPPEFAKDLALVEHYEANPEFQAEEHRIHRYGLFFDFFNAALVAILIVRFARKPLIDFLAAQAAGVRERIETAAQERQEAQQRRQRAEGKLAHLDEERERVAEETARRLDQELADLKEANERSAALLSRELADRKRQEVVAAHERVKRELVDETIERLAERCRAEQSAEREAQLVDQFVRDLEARV